MIGTKRLFQMGFKPALLCTRLDDHFDEFVGKYPYVEASFTGKSSNRLLTIRVFLQNEEMKSEFEKKAVIQQNESTTYPFDEKELGIFLGFPEIAATDYANKIEPDDRVCIDYHGLAFVVSRANAIRCLEDLKKRMPISPELKLIHHSTVKTFLLTENGFTERSIDEL